MQQSVENGRIWVSRPRSVLILEVKQKKRQTDSGKQKQKQKQTENHRKRKVTIQASSAPVVNQLPITRPRQKPQHFEGLCTNLTRKTLIEV